MTSVEATIRFITELLGFFLNTTRNMEVSHYIDFKEPSIVSNKEPKIVNLPNYHKEFSLIFKMRLSWSKIHMLLVTTMVISIGFESCQYSFERLIPSGTEIVRARPRAVKIVEQLFNSVRRNWMITKLIKGKTITLKIFEEVF